MRQLNSQQFIHMLEEGEASRFLRGPYHFATLSSGLSLHGGTFTAQKDLQLSRWIAPYISFLVLLEGDIDFALNQHRHRITAGRGKIILIATAREGLFRRYLHAGSRTCKLTIKGLERWLAQSSWQDLLPALYATPVRCWDLGADIRELAADCLACARDGRDFAQTLAQEAAVLQLLSALWHSYRAHFPERDAPYPRRRQDAHFAARLDRAFSSGAHKVADLAAALSVSERTLQRRLHDYYGLTAGDWLRHKHMQYALQALDEGRASIGEIAWQCGYRQSSAFIQAFKKHFGCTPAKIRNLHKNR